MFCGLVVNSVGAVGKDGVFEELAKGLLHIGRGSMAVALPVKLT